ncbi:MAG TPA: rRNA adenine N-6-methyltransferase family protein, partial [Sediminibacterium sp.]|nr:rRNA adenine N-6-methyltransferase family protein [Sediminibacterium sp.]
MQYTLKKSLGQHFLTNEAICKQIVTALQEDSIHQVLEVGPGAGALTKHLLKLPIQHFKAVELDREKVAYLKLNYPSIVDMIIEGSILDIPIPFQD